VRGIALCFYILTPAWDILLCMHVHKWKDEQKRWQANKMELGGGGGESTQIRFLKLGFS